MLNMSQEELVRIFEKVFGCKILSDGNITNDWINLEDYNYPLPNSIISVGTLRLKNYQHPLPDSILYVDGWLIVNNDYTGLSDNITVYGKVKAICYNI